MPQNVGLSCKMLPKRLHTLEMGADDHGTPAPHAQSLDTQARKLFDEQRQEQMHASACRFRVGRRLVRQKSLAACCGSRSYLSLLGLGGT